MTFHYKDGVFCVGNTALPDIAKLASTPCYIYSADIIRKKFSAFASAIQNPWPKDNQPFIAFACKANSNIAILKLLNKLGAGMDIVSGGEMLRCMNAGTEPSKIIFSGVGKTDAELELAVRHAILQVNVESVHEIERLDVITRTLRMPLRVALRYTPDIESGAHEKTSTGEEANKFGLLQNEIFDLFARFSEHPYLKLSGLSMHIGSGVPMLDPFHRAFTMLADLVTGIRGKGGVIDQVDIGGGIWVRYRDEPEADLQAYGRMIHEIFSPLNVKVALEPGRFLVAESGVLLTQVILNKTRTEKKFVVVDAAMNDLIRPTLYDSFHAVLPVVKTDRETIPCDIVGPVCETGDYIALDRDLPPVQPGEYLAIMTCGAYGSVMSGNYNTRPLIAEVMIDNEHVAVIRKAQNLESIWVDESIPDWLE